MFDYFNGYWKWAADNTEKVNPTTTAMYFYILSVANQLNWKPSFGLTSTQTMDGIGISNYKTYKKHFDLLVEYGLINVIKESKNQYSCKIIALPKITIASGNAVPKQVEKQVKSTAHIHKTLKTIKDYKDLIEEKEYFKNEKLKQTFLDFIENRIANKSKPTEKAVGILVKKLGELSKKNPVIAINIIENSIANNWKSFFDIKDNNFKNNSSNDYSRASGNKITIND